LAIYVGKSESDEIVTRISGSKTMSFNDESSVGTVHCCEAVPMCELIDMGR
jgi:hypothetical protein